MFVGGGRLQKIFIIILILIHIMIIIVVVLFWLQIKAQCQKGIPASVRSRCWPLLCGAKQRQENNNELYKVSEYVSKQ